MPSSHKILVMAKKTAPASAAKKASAPSRVSAADFKATCLELMDRVRETGAEFVVTKHGRPVAKLVPYRGSDRTALFGSMKGTVLQYDRPFDPIDGDYDIDHA
jgi:prevent-host-death family protein